MEAMTQVKMNVVGKSLEDTVDNAIEFRRGDAKHAICML